MPYKLAFKMTPNFIDNSTHESAVQNELGKKEQLRKEAGKLQRPRAVYTADQGTTNPVGISPGV